MTSRYGDEAEVTGLVGANIVLRPPLTPANYLTIACNDIDTKLFTLYGTPLDFTSSPTGVKLYVDGIANRLAAGRLIMALHRGEENASVHAYGLYLMKDAQEALMSLINGSVTLPGVPAANNPSTGTQPDVPLITNQDPFSLVDVFYDFAAQPRRTFRGY